MRTLVILLLLCCPALAQSDAVRSQAKQYLFAWYDDGLELDLLRQSLVREATVDRFASDQGGGPILDEEHLQNAGLLLRSLYDPVVRLNCAFRGHACDDQWTSWQETIGRGWTFLDAEGRPFHIRKLFLNEAVLAGFSVGRQCEKVEIDESEPTQSAACHVIVDQIANQAWKPW